MQTEAAGELVADPERRGATLSKSQRLTRRGDFAAVYDNQQRRVGRNMVFWALPREGQAIRLGVVASRKVGNAVCRARAKRLLREAFRRNRALLAGHADVVLVARRDLLKAAWPEVNEELLRLARKIGLLRGEGVQGKACAESS